MTSNRTNTLSPEVRSRPVWPVLDHEHEHSSRWAAIGSVAPKTTCLAPTLNEWIKKIQVVSRNWPSVPADVAERLKRAERLKTLERENRELRQTNEILRKASTYFAQPAAFRSYREEFGEAIDMHDDIYHASWKPAEPHPLEGSPRHLHNGSIGERNE